MGRVKNGLTDLTSFFSTLSFSMYPADTVVSKAQTRYSHFKAVCPWSHHTFHALPLTSTLFQTHCSRPEYCYGTKAYHFYILLVGYVTAHYASLEPHTTHCQGVRIQSHWDHICPKLCTNGTVGQLSLFALFFIY